MKKEKIGSNLKIKDKDQDKVSVTDKRRDKEIVTDRDTENIKNIKMKMTMMMAMDLLLTTRKIKDGRKRFRKLQKADKSKSFIIRETEKQFLSHQLTKSWEKTS